MKKAEVRTAEGKTVSYQAVRSKALQEAGQEFLTHLLRHFENDRHDVLELELEFKEPREPAAVDLTVKLCLNRAILPNNQGGMT